MPNPQKSEVHDTTADATDTPGDRGGNTKPKGGTTPGSKPIEATVTESHVVRDESDAGGPLVLESSDPALQSIELHGETDAGERTPEVDLPAK